MAGESAGLPIMDPRHIRSNQDVLAGIQQWTDWWERRNRTLLLFDEIGGGDLAHRQKDMQMISVTPIDFFVSALLFLDSENHDPIRLLINSPGGNIISGLALIQVMRDIVSPVHTVVLGEAASMAAVIAVAGDRRLAYPQARWLLHRGKSTAAGDSDDIGIAAKELRVRDGQADLVVVNSTRIPAERLKKMQAKDKWLSTDEALKWGLIDEIIQPRKGPAKWNPDKAFLKSLREQEEDEEAEAEERGKPA